MSNSLRLSLLNKYQCLADHCPDNCCHRWNVDVDEDTLRRWQTIKNKDRQDFILASTVVVNNKGQEGRVIQQHDDGTCIHSDSQGLCCIQRDFGHDFLPTTCRQYPRANIARHEIILESAHISCPAITELLTGTDIDRLMEDESMLYDDADDSITGRLSIVLHNYTRQLFANPALSNGLRLYLISELLSEVMKQAVANSLTLDSLNSCYVHAVSNNKHYPDTGFTDKRKDNISHFLSILDTGLFSKYKTVLSEKFSVSIEMVSLDEIITLSTGLATDTHDNLLRNYLYLKFINHGFPWNPFRNSHAASFLDCVLPFIICHLLVLAHIRSGVTVDNGLLQKIICSVEKLNSHNFDNFELIGKNPQLLGFENYNQLFILLP